ncbi:metallopeptidase TldD-related protein [Myxococcota bacterium]|nr:metallopeptidase TldD-related protein [Myxococcota bacterium]
MRSREERHLLAACEAAVAAAKPHGAVAEARTSDEALTRFAAGAVTADVGAEKVSLSLTVIDGRRRATASAGSLDAASVKELAERARAMVRLAPEDEEVLPPLGPQDLPRVSAAFASTARLDARRRARIAAALLARARADALLASGTVSRSLRSHAIATSAGMAETFTETRAGLSLTCRTPDGTGSSRVERGGVPDAAAIDVEALADACARTARASARPQEIPPGRHAAILAPAAVAALLAWLPEAMDARETEEGRSAFSRLGETGGWRGAEVAVGRISLVSAPRDPRFRLRPWGEEGVPTADGLWIDRGRLVALPHDRFWAGRSGVAPMGPPRALVLDARGRGSLDDLVASTERGILVTSLWYIRMVDPMELLLTGLTRDGLFLVQDGRVAASLANLRFNDSPLRVLGALDGASRVEYGSDGRGGIVAPALRVPGFHFTAPSPAV